MPNTGKIEISVVVPVFNNQESLLILTDTVRALMKREHKNYEMVFVNDGSTDNSKEILENIEHENKNILIVNQANKGQHHAILNGISASSGEKIVVLDADLQDDANKIVDLADCLGAKYDAAFVQRMGRYESNFRMVGSFLLKCIVWMLVGLHPRAGSYFVVHNRLKSSLIQSNRKHPYVTILVCHFARHIKYLPVNRSKSKYPSGYNYFKRLRAGMHAIRCSIECKMNLNGT